MHGKIWKYEIPLTVTQQVWVPIQQGAKILSVQVQKENIVFWAVVDPAERKVCRLFHTVMTGASFSVGPNAHYLASVDLLGYVIHVFEDATWDSAVEPAPEEVEA